MSFVKPAKGTPAVRSASRRPTHEATPPGRERPLRGGPAEQRAPRHSSRDHAPTPLPRGTLSRTGFHGDCFRWVPWSFRR